MTGRVDAGHDAAQESGGKPGTGRPADDPARLSLVAHDLRAAVSDIIGGLRLIDQTGLDDGTRLQLERIRSSGESLARLLEESLALMLGEAEPEAAHPSNVQVARLVYDLEMRWAGKAREKGLAFRASVSHAVPPVVAVDRVALERVLSNLLSNAIKYTDAGAVEFRVEREPDGTLRFSVIDDGPGFSPEALARLFQFEGRPEGTGKPGHGLGMHISKDLTGRLGGQIRVQNRPAGGAEVMLDLSPGTWAAAVSDEGQDLPDLSRVKLLVAEDNATNQSIIAGMLTRMGAQFEMAEDGVEALHWIEREDFDAALIDIEMPRLSGIEVIRAIRASERLAAMPVIAVTAYILRAHREAIYAAGADSILSKPLPSPEAVGLAISAALARVSAVPVPDPLDEGNAAGEAGSGGDADRPDIDRAQFHHLLDIAGPEAAQELLERLCTDLRRCERGLVAANATGDRAALRAETHVLIALAGAVGGNRLRTLSEALNLSAHRRDDPARGRLTEGCLEQIDRLIRFVEGERARMAEVP